jgi:hypothetical protein
MKFSLSAKESDEGPLALKVMLVVNFAREAGSGLKRPQTLFATN